MNYIMHPCLLLNGEIFVLCVYCTREEVPGGCPGGQVGLGGGKALQNKGIFSNPPRNYFENWMKYATLVFMRKK